MSKRDITIDDLFRMKLLNSPEISPDGKRIVFTYRWTDVKSNCYYSNLYMANLETGSVVPFTRGDNHDGYAQWSPDGKNILFRSDRQKKPGLWLIPSEGGEAYPLFTEKGAVAEFTWSPDSKHVAFTFRKPDPHVPSAHLSGDPSYNPKEEDENPYDIIEDIPYKSKGGSVYPKGKFHIYMIDIESKEKVQLTNEKFSDGNLCFSPDGKKLAFTSNRCENPLKDYENTDVYLLDLDTKEQKKISHTWGSKAGFAWTSDAKSIYFTGHEVPKGEGGTADMKIFRMCVETGKTELISKNFQGYVSNMLIGDAREFDDIEQPVAFLCDNKNVLFCASYHGGCYLYEVDKDGGDPRRIEEGKHEVVYYSIDKKGENMAVLKGDALNPSELFHYKKTANGWETKKLTSYNSYLIEETNISNPEEMWITNSENVKIQGWLIKPANFDPSKKYPLIQEIHGGPKILYGYTFFHEMQYFVSKGYCVLFINPRGSKGYGQDFTKPIEGNWGVPDYKDQMEFLDHVISLGFIDKSKLFVTGGSYGGYMTNWIVTQTDRYCAAVSHRSICNFASVFGVSSGCCHFGNTFGGVPWRDYDVYRQHSPIYHVENVKTPILLMQSENDHLTPTGEAEQFFVALRCLEKKVRFVRFKNETHELSRSGKPTNRRARLDISLDWFEKHRNAAAL
ncbi:MAG: S9 family peptidase [Candidatus Brocadiae bacterium]|nr:S9 family peptidase [Candidatus Brocadiia bacterium]